ncbi:MAG: hypothetical protein M3619_28850 [Myxococcota bacterium]|nr:hypothetical protein [Myxococcota bacterium]
MNKAGVKKARLKKKPLEASTPPSFSPREEHDAIQAGDIVMLPDGGMAAVEQIVGTDAYVVEWHKQIGRGPWIFPVSELTLTAP